MSGEDQIRPCPFCSSKAKLFSHDMDEKKTIWWVQCSNSHCLARLTPKRNAQDALNRWNAWGRTRK